MNGSGHDAGGVLYETVGADFGFNSGCGLGLVGCIDCAEDGIGFICCDAFLFSEEGIFFSGNSKNPPTPAPMTRVAMTIIMSGANHFWFIVSILPRSYKKF
jgi:hypothetical protein